MGFRENYVELNKLDVSEIRSSNSSVELYSKRFIKLVVDSGGDSWDPNIWVYVGIGKDYVVIPRIYCSCTSFAIEVVGGKKMYCKHLLYQLVSETYKNYRVLKVGGETLYKVIKEIMDLNISVTLRRILYRGVENG